MRKFCAVFFFYFLLAFCRAQTFNGIGGSIPNNNTVKDFDLTISGLSPSTLDTIGFGLEQVCIYVSHGNVSDLEIQLQSPDGTSVLLVSAIGGSGNNFATTCFRGDVTAPVQNGSAPFNGSYLPMGDLSNMNNQQSGNGIWKLQIRDMNAGTTGTLFGWSLTFGNNPAQSPLQNFSSNLPIIKIETYGQTIPDEPKITAAFSVIDNGNGNRNYYTGGASFLHPIGIELRGSSSQWSTSPKRSYGFETWDSLSNEMDTSILGLPSQSDWILHANYYDKTLMRNVLSYNLANKTGHYASRTKYCELFINGLYQGVYVLMEKIKRDKNRVDIAKLSPEDTTGDELTGGYIIKLDKFTGSGGGGFYSNFPPQNPTGDAVYYQYEYPNDINISSQQKKYIQKYVDSFETALYGNSFQDTANGYRKFAGEKSFLDYMFINEISKNVDGYRLSTYFNKDRASNGGKLKAGPVWDYDITYMNADYCEAYIDTGWAYNFNYVCPGNWVPAHWERMMQDTLFQKHARCRWKYFRKNIFNTDTLYAWIDSLAAYIDEGQQRNFATWQELGLATWPEPQPIPQTYAEEVQRLKDWLWNRFVWLDAQFNSFKILNYKIDLGHDTIFCNGNSIQLNAGNFSYYKWNTGDTTSFINVAANGNYTVTVSDEFNCSGTGNINITVMKPDASFSDTALSVFNYHFTPDNLNMVSYNYNFGDGNSSSQQSPSHTYTGNGTYIVSLTVTDNIGCVETSYDTIVINYLGIENLMEQEISIYPNPVKDELMVYISHFSVSETTINVFDVMGNEIFETNSFNVHCKLTTANLLTGVYFIEVRTADKIFTAKFLKE